MADLINENQEPNESDMIKQSVADEIRSAQNAINESNSALEKMRQEVNKLTQRNTDISTRIQQTVQNLETLPRSEIKLTYDNALDAQKRYLLIRGQLEKVQSDIERWQHYENTLIKIQNFLNEQYLDAESHKEGSVNSIDEIIAIEENERGRLSKLLHDGPAQALTNFILQVEIATRAFDADPNQVKEELVNLKTSAMKVFQRVRTFIYDLKPFTLEEQGLIQALKKIIEAYKEQTGIDISFKVNGTERPLGQIIETVIFRSIQEILSNTSTYSQASLVNIQLEYNDRSIEVQVEDNGKGFDIGKLSEGRNSGLNKLINRIEGMGGKLLVDSNLDVGTKINFNLPAQREVGS
ncbi:MAG: hypothetical protein JW704_01745 [Anaerolineaceae bacterium]|nr:hypothetical protein [Anaerolineaceae bacterium]MBN2677484.1 hypothetical protein [Anaerolineaceae bacterium]